MPLEVTDFSVMQDYVNSAPGVKIYFRQENRKLVVVAGMLAWRGTLKPDEMQTFTDWLQEKDAIEVKSFRDVRELFA